MSCSCWPSKVSVLTVNNLRTYNCSDAPMRPMDLNSCSSVLLVVLFNVYFSGVHGWDMSNLGASGSLQHWDGWFADAAEYAKWPHIVGLLFCLWLEFCKCSRNVGYKLWVGQLSAQHLAQRCKPFKELPSVLSSPFVVCLSSLLHKFMSHR